MSKIDRIKRVQPLFESRRVYLPERLIRVDYQGRNYDLVQEFVNQEYLQFPYMTHDDMLDCLARITDADLKPFFPSAGRFDRDAPMDNDADSTYDYDTYAYIGG
jgi:hypothetical protein